MTFLGTKLVVLISQTQNGYMYFLLETNLAILSKFLLLSWQLLDEVEHCKFFLKVVETNHALAPNKKKNATLSKKLYLTIDRMSYYTRWFTLINDNSMYEQKLISHVIIMTPTSNIM